MHRALTARHTKRIVGGMEQIIRIWPSLALLATDLGVPYPTVAAWRQRGSIPARYDLDLVEAARRRGHELALSDLAEARRMAARSKQDAA
jgi:hypothetical protein